MEKLPKKSKLTPMPKLIKKADLVFSKWIRNRDKQCVLHSEKCSSVLQCGHLIRRGKRAVRFSEVNCNALCSFCNYKDNFEHDHYVMWFIKKHGADKYEELLEKSKVIYKFTRDELNEIIDKYK